MNPASRWAIAALSFLLCGAAGWILAGSGPRTLSNDAQAPTVPGKLSGRSQAGSKRGVPDEVNRLLAPVRAAKSPAERARAAAQLALNLPIGEIGRWYEAGWFGAEDSLEAETFFRITRDRWLAEDATGLIDFLIDHQHRGLNDSARAWAGRDPKAALEYLFSQTDETRKAQMYGMASFMAWGLGEDVDPGVVNFALGRMAETKVYGGPELVKKLVALKANAEPGRLAEEAVNWPEPMRKIATDLLNREELQRDPAAALARIRGEPDSKQSFIDAITSKAGLASELFARVGEWPEGAFLEMVQKHPTYLVGGDLKKWLEIDLTGLGLSDQELMRVRVRAIQQFVRDNPKEALGSILAREVSPEERQMAIQEAFTKMTRGNDALSTEMLALLTDKEEIAFAEKAIEEDRERVQSEKKGPVGPAEWITSLSRASDGTIQMTPRNWTKAEVDVARGEFQKLAPEEKAKAAQVIMQDFRGTQALLSADAISYLAENHVDDGKSKGRSPFPAASMMISQWGSRDPGAASRWAGSLPDGKLRSTALRLLAGKWSEYDPAEARRWIATLPEEERAGLEKHIEQSMGNPR